MEDYVGERALRARKKKWDCTALPPSLMQQTLVKLRISRETSALCVGEHRHATMADSFVVIAINSFLNKLRQSCGNMME